MTDPTAPDDPPGSRPRRLDQLVVARGAASALVVAAPAALANVLLASQDPKPKGALNLTLLVMLVGFVVGGFVAGLEARRDAARHGAAAGFAAFVLVQVVGVLGRLDRGDPINLAQIVIVGLLAACAGTVGAQLGARRRARRRQP
jgi:putative membrane protein (TIGR04086 family)